MNINANIQPPDKSMEAGGTIRNTKITLEGPIDARGNLLKGIVINSTNPNVTVDGGLISYPDGTPGAEVGPFGVISDGANTIVRNLTVTGRPVDRWEANIYVRNGIVSECIAERIRVDSAPPRCSGWKCRRRLSPTPTRLSSEVTRRHEVTHVVQCAHSRPTL